MLGPLLIDVVTWRARVTVDANLVRAGRIVVNAAEAAKATQRQRAEARHQNRTPTCLSPVPTRVSVSEPFATLWVVNRFAQPTPGTPNSSGANSGDLFARAAGVPHVNVLARRRPLAAPHFPHLSHLTLIQQLRSANPERRTYVRAAV